jgi:hypothetical protein
MADAVTSQTIQDGEGRRFDIDHKYARASLHVCHDQQDLVAVYGDVCED